MSEPREKAPAEMSDRELNDFVLLQVLRYRYEPRFPGDAAGYWIAPGGERYIDEERPNPATDPAAMMEVIQKMRSKGFSGLIEWLADEGSEIADVVVSINHDDFEWPVAAEGEKIERTYAIAALLAVREGEK